MTIGRPWTPEEHTLLDQLVMIGARWPQIAKRLNRTVGSCRATHHFRTAEKRAMMPIVSGPQGVWTEARVALLRKLQLAGLTYGEIAVELGGGLTRNACICKAMRMGLSKRPHTGGKKGWPRSARAKPPVNRKISKIVKWGRGGAMREIETVECEQIQSSLSAHDIPVGQRKQLLELEPHHCRWPYGDVGSDDFFFCGGDKMWGYSYCAMHARVSFHRVKNVTPAEQQRRDEWGKRMQAIRAKYRRDAA